MENQKDIIASRKSKGPGNSMMDSFRKSRNDPSTYIEKKKYGGVGHDDSDEDSDDPNLADKSPMTKRRIKDDN
jgi:hypothetical protein|tara:strand:- start:54 stop:272 length:219 start_codon:yes stop_codon:yes gene_type:complete